MRELRCDFRRYYGCSYDEVPVEECLDLVWGLPDGSLYVAATCPPRAWSEQRQLAADIREAAAGMWPRGLIDEGGAPSRLPRPWDAELERLAAAGEAAEARRAESVRRTIETTDWVEV